MVLKLSIYLEICFNLKVFYVPSSYLQVPYIIKYEEIQSQSKYFNTIVNFNVLLVYIYLQPFKSLY